MNAFLALLRKDLLLHFSNRRAVLMSFVAPILIAAFFGSLFGGTSRPSGVAIAVIDQDNSETSRRVVAALRGDAALIVSNAPAEAVPALLQKGELRATITLPAGFGEQALRALMAGGAKPTMDLRYDPSQASTLPLVRGLATQHTMGAISASLAARNPGSASFSAPFQMREAASAAPGAANSMAGYNSYAHSFAGMGVQFILLMGVDMGIGLLLMRRMDLWKRLRAAPLSRSTLLGSRVASCATIAMVVFAVIYTVAVAVFKVRVSGSLVGFVAVLLAFSVMTASFGLLIAAIGRTPEATRGLAILVTLLMVMLGGAWVPSFIFPEWLQTVAMAAPTYWAVEGLDAMTWRALPLQSAVAPVAALLGFTALFSTLALWRFKWEE